MAMKIDDIMNEIERLSQSQGFYSRLYEQLKELKQNNIEVWNDFVKEMEAQNFKNTIDMIMYLEGGH